MKHGKAALSITMELKMTDNFPLQSVLKHTSKYPLLLNRLLIKLKCIDKLLIGNISLLIFTSDCA